MYYSFTSSLHLIGEKLVNANNASRTLAVLRIDDIRENGKRK